MCLEGGCGACVVNVRAIGASTHQYTDFSVNSKRLNHYFGSQCGYCSPGFIMSMYSLVKSSDHHLTQEEVERSFGSNLCRCTGYRPILEAFKSLTKNSRDDVMNKVKDIEDINDTVCPKTGAKCGGTCEEDSKEWCIVDIQEKLVDPKKIYLCDGRLWHVVNNVISIFNVLNETGYDSYMLVAGNTAKGARPTIYPKVLIDISNVPELTAHYLDVNLVLGGNISLTDTMNIFKELSRINDDFWYLKIFYNHLLKVAHIPVRNIGTLAGNLVLKHQHPDFQSDIFILLECVGAIVRLCTWLLRYPINFTVIK
ncbi:Antennal aldehyde oxidase, partial [Operophtera brumata]